MKKLIKLFCATAIISVLLSPVAFAQDNVTEIEEDETVLAEDLDLEEPNLLPDSRWYFLKNWKRGIQNVFTRDKAKKAILQMKHASERLLEARKLAEKLSKPEIIEKATEKYQRAIEKLKEKAVEIRDSDAKDKFLDKFTHQQILHQKILDKLEDKVPTSTLERIRRAREVSLEKFGEVMEKLAGKEGIKQRLEDGFNKIKGSQFKSFKDIELLKRFEDKAPEGIKEKIREVAENRLQQFTDKIKDMTPDVQYRLKQYIEGIKGTGRNRVEILERIKEKLEQRPDIRQRLGEAATGIIEQVRNRAQIEGKKCPLNVINPNSCNGRIVITEDINGCPIPRCKQAVTACTALWDPVCGTNDKTYTNECRAKAAGVEIKHKEICQSSIVAPSTNGTKSCEELERNIREEINKEKFCNRANDCVESPENLSSILCSGYVVKKNANLVKARQIMRVFVNNECPVPDCSSKQTYGVACVDNKCQFITNKR